jgi:hypothetical protein
MLLPDNFDPQNPRGTRWNYISVTLTELTSELHLPTQTPSPPSADSSQEASNGMSMSSRRGLMDSQSAHSLLLHCRRNLATLKGFVKGGFPSFSILLCPVLPHHALPYPMLPCSALLYPALFYAVRSAPPHTLSIPILSDRIIPFYAQPSPSRRMPTLLLIPTLLIVSRHILPVLSCPAY